MAPGTRQRKVLDHRTTARLPQELFDAIIGELDLPGGYADSTLVSLEYRTLKACALTTRAFTRPSQMKLFARVDLQRNDSQAVEPRALKFSKLLSFHPHVAQHVKTLLLCHHMGRSTTFNHILSALPSLQALYFHPYSLPFDTARIFPGYLKDHLMPALSLGCLRRLELGVLSFKNASVLESLLSESVGLKHLILDRIAFASVLYRGDTVPGPPRVVLDSLRLVRMDLKSTACILRTFAAVDIKHLRSFTCDGSDLNCILEANGGSIQELEIRGSHCSISAPLEKVLPADNHIRSLVVTSSLTPDDVIYLLRAVGALAHLNSLRTLTLRIPCRLSDVLPTTDSVVSYWSRIDQHLVESGDGHGDVAVAYEWFETAENGARLRKLLPLLDQKGVLKICPPGSRRTMFPY
ncbi:hypothetical protein C8J57DRAFT_1322206 [Mycena rebaudengoi]|nr:hypothetical protein C8J57DRAFT_1374919 [Mycena rebaudengoi]KAJ7269516.1 hypothetical protein C8J57DRAFT_1322206 [Mycena rebaudengoi]